MKRVILSTGLLLIIVIGIFSFLVYEDIKYTNIDTSKYENKVKNIEKDISKNKEEIDTIKNDNQDKVRMLELWEKEIEKALNY